jgi:hypothetical protein
MCLQAVRFGAKMRRSDCTDANDQRADGEAGDCVLDQVRGAGSQQRRRRPHALVVVGRLERFAAAVSTAPHAVPSRSALTTAW